LRLAAQRRLVIGLKQRRRRYCIRFKPSPGRALWQHRHHDGGEERQHGNDADDLEESKPILAGFAVIQSSW
jgi:hypothetical protein